MSDKALEFLKELRELFAKYDACLESQGSYYGEHFVQVNVGQKEIYWFDTMELDRIEVEDIDDAIRSQIEQGQSLVPPTARG
jgi:hypothetical protein